MENQQKKWTYLIMDLEMTGLNPFVNGVIEVGMMAMNDKFEIIWEFLMDLCPPANVIIDPESLKYNGFTLDRIARGRSYEEFCEFFEEFFNTHFPNSTPIIVGQFVTADLSFLASVFHLARRNSLYSKLGNDIIDTKSIANAHNAIARFSGKELPYKSTSLSKPGGLSESLGVPPYEAHTARGDIMATRAVLLKFLWIEK